MQLLLNEVLQKVSNAKTKAQKIKLLEEYNTPALRQVLIANFDESVISMLPEGDVPYKQNDAPEETEHTVLVHDTSAPGLLLLLPNQIKLLHIGK